MSATARWFELSAEVAADRAEAVAEALEHAGAQSSAFADAGDEPLYEPPPGSEPLWARTRITALFATREAAEAARAMLPPELGATVAIGEVADRDWIAAGEAHAVAREFGSHLVVAPQGAAVREDAVVVRLTPGLAFGTGGHPSTAMCLEWLATLPLSGATVLDWGCGSGVLAIAALRLGAGAALAVDVDPQALAATRANAARNDVLERLSVVRPEWAPAIAADCVVANILAGPLRALAPELLARARPGAAIALAGLLASQAEEVRAAYDSGARLEIAARSDDWVLLAGERVE